MSGTIDSLSHDQPLRIIIAGGGIGGLTAATALRRQGHIVHVYEQSRMSQEVGAAVHMAPNADGLLKRVGVEVGEVGGVEYGGFTEIVLETDKYNYELFFTSFNRRTWQHPYRLVHRARLHTALRKQALAPTSAESPGVPVELHLSSKVEHVDVKTATLTLVDGTKVEGDVIIGADGVGSATRKYIPNSQDRELFDSGRSAFRALVPIEDVLAVPVLKKIFGGKDGYLVHWVGADRRVIVYPCDDGKTINMAAMHPSVETSDLSKSGWNREASKERMLKAFDKSAESLKAFLNTIPDEGIKLWTLLDMKQMPTYVADKFALIGDAAHPFLPYQAQGAAQAIEDASSLAATLPFGTRPADVPSRLQLYEQQRYNRSSDVQNFTRWAGREADKIKEEGDEYDPLKFAAIMYGHDEWHSTVQALRKQLAAEANIHPAEPYGFGLPPYRYSFPSTTPSPALELASGTATSGSRAVRVRFTTSRTFLQGLLPAGFRYLAPATRVEATLVLTEWAENGKLRTRSALLLHGVAHVTESAAPAHGMYLPVLFEDSPAPSDLSPPAVQATTSFAVSSDSVRVTLSAAGNVFAAITLSQLSAHAGEKEATGAYATPLPVIQPLALPPLPAGSHPIGPPGPIIKPAEKNIYFYKLPASGAGYPVAIPVAKEGVAPAATPNLSAAKDASITFSAAHAASFPAPLSHVALALAELPIISIQTATFVEAPAGVELPEINWQPAQRV